MTYPFYSGTAQYPNETSKWQALAHEICPDNNAGDYTKAYELHEWMSHNLVYDERRIADADGNERNKPLLDRWAENGGGEWSPWNTHIGVCFDFSNIYAIMCRELGVPCRIIVDKTIDHDYNAIYLYGRWEIVDLTASCDIAYIENTMEDLQEFWDYWDGPGSAAEDSEGFLIPAFDKYWTDEDEIDRYKTVEARIAALYPTLDCELCTKDLLRRFGGKYDH